MERINSCPGELSEPEGKTKGGEGGETISRDKVKKRERNMDIKKARNNLYYFPHQCRCQQGNCFPIF